MSQQTNQNRAIKFMNGGLAGMMSTCIVQPVDLIKTRMQLQLQAGGAGRDVVSVAMNIMKQEGFYGMYNGLSAALFRQATYTTTRMGVFQVLMDKFTPRDADGKSMPVPFFQRAAMGVTAGGIGAIVGTPAEVSLIRMTGDGRLPAAERRNYKHVFDALGRMAKEEGVLTLWRGASPTVIRAMVLNGAQLAGYSQAKDTLKSTGFFVEGYILHTVASIFSGLLSTIVSMPVDITKTRLQNMKMIDGKPQYKGVVDVLTKIIANEGFFSLWKGFIPYFFRLGPHTILTFIFLEQLNKFMLGQSMK